MKNTPDFFMRVYQRTLKLYPTSFQQQYGDEMAQVFRQGSRQAAYTSGGSLLRFGLRELRDLPASLLREHWTELWRGIMHTNMQPSEPLPKSIVRGVLGFGIGFALVYLLYCVVDTFLNAGTQVWQGTSIWNGFQWLHPTALAYAFGAGIMGIYFNKRRAWVSALLVFLLYTLIWRVWAVVYLANRSPRPSDLESLLVPYIFSTIMGLVIGASIGWIQRGPKQVGRYMLAGVVGFNLGWLIENTVSLSLILSSPFARGLDRLVVGNPWYYLYFIVPAILYGAVVGLCLSIPAAAGRERAPITA